MADKFELGTRQWVGAEPRIHLPPEETIEAIAWDELNERARKLREATRGMSLSGIISEVSGEPTVIIKFPTPSSADRGPEAA